LTPLSEKGAKGYEKEGADQGSAVREGMLLKEKLVGVGGVLKRCWKRKRRIT